MKKVGGGWIAHCARRSAGEEKGGGLRAARRGQVRGRGEHGGAVHIGARRGGRREGVCVGPGRKREREEIGPLGLLRLFFVFSFI